MTAAAERQRAKYAEMSPAEKKAKRQRERPGRIRRKVAEQHRIRREVITAYGGRCACCKKDHLPHLTLDHIEGGGAVERKTVTGRTLYRRLRNLLPELDPGFRVLCWCWCCNSAVGLYGACTCQGGEFH